MSPAEFSAALEALHWPASYVAEQAGYHRTLGYQWSTGRSAVPDHVAEWLGRVLAALRRVGPPPSS
jgi:hypothetical protein